MKLTAKYFIQKVYGSKLSEVTYDEFREKFFDNDDRPSIIYGIEANPVYAVQKINFPKGNTCDEGYIISQYIKDYVIKRCGQGGYKWKVEFYNGNEFMFDITGLDTIKII